MNFFAASIFSILSLLPILAFSNYSKADSYKAARLPVKYDECYSRALRIELNVAGKTPKADLVEAIKLFADYPNLTFTPVDADRVSLAFQTKPAQGCFEAKCARDAGFNEVQIRLMRFKGVAITCALDMSPPGGSAQQDEAPNAPKREGGVTSGN